MSLYKRPLSPFDPIIKEGQDAGAVRYYRDDFSNSGQDSFTQPPAQDPTLWQKLFNTMPVSRKNIDRRWGYGLFSDISTLVGSGIVPTHVYEFQRDSDGLRKLVICTTTTAQGQGNSFAIGEDGTIYATNITLAPAGMDADDSPRAVMSRNTMYFYGSCAREEEQVGSNIKWDGTSGSGQGVSKWGIDINQVAGSTSGPNYAGTSADTNTLAYSRPTLTGSYLYNAYTNPTYAEDGNPATSATATSSTSTSHGQHWNGFSSNAGTSASSVQLRITSTVTFTAATGTVALIYSLDSGSTLHTIYSVSGNRSLTTDTVTLTVPPGQDLEQVWVFATTVWTSGTSVHHDIVDIWIESKTVWANPSNAQGTPDGLYATATFTNPGVSDQLQLTNYGLSASGQVVGIQVDLTSHVTSTGLNLTIFRPTTNAPYLWNPYSNPSYAQDGNPATSSVGTADGVNGPDPLGEQWAGFTAYSGPLPSLVNIKVTSQVSIIGVGSTGYSILQYSLDGGVTINTQYNTTVNRALTTDAITIPNNQDLTKVIVYSQAENDGAGTGRSQITRVSVVDVWIEVSTSTAIPPGCSLQVQLIKNGNPFGLVKSIGITNGSDTLLTFGGTADLWGGAWFSSDLTVSNFGVQISVNNTLTNSTTIVYVDSAAITVYLTGAGVVITSTAGAGSLTLVIGRIYYLAFTNTTTKHISDLSFPSASTGPLTNKQVSLTLPVSLDPQVDTKLLLATADGGDPSTLYLVTTLPNATTTYVDQANDTTIVLNQIYQETDQFGNEYGIANNTPPPIGDLAIKHQGRLWMAVGQLLYFSKGTPEITLPDGFQAGRYEEAWPATNFFDISPGAETVTGLLSDGSTLYIGTQRHVRRLFGSDPTNFQEPEVLLQGVGVVNQDVWCPIFMEGTPAGAMWLTPDNKVILSDFNTYRDVGTPIQDILNTINQSNVYNAHATYASFGQYDVYILCVPTGSNANADTHLVFDIRTQMWHVWYPTDPSTTIHFNINASGIPQWLFATLSYVYQYSPAYTQDRSGQTPVNYTTTAQTSWMDLGFPSFRKFINELEIVGDPSMLVTLEGANNQVDFTSPFALATNATLNLDPLNNYKVYVASSAGNFKRYRMTFTSTGPNQNFLNNYSIYTIPISAL